MKPFGDELAAGSLRWTGGVVSGMPCCPRVELGTMLGWEVLSQVGLQEASELWAQSPGGSSREEAAVPVTGQGRATDG